jgi:hypothetical protein
MLACMFKLHFTSLGCHDLLVIIISFFCSSVVFKFTRKSIYRVFDRGGVRWWVTRMVERPGCSFLGVGEISVVSTPTR